METNIFTVVAIYGNLHGSQKLLCMATCMVMITYMVTRSCFLWQHTLLPEVAMHGNLHCSKETVSNGNN